MNVKFNILMMASLLLFGCAKSDVLGPESGNEQIGFETYIGRDAETKAASYGSEVLPASIGVYGFYFGADSWSATETPNLWTNLPLNETDNWAIPKNQKKYWTNSKDNYTFLSYAPYATDTGETDNFLVASTGANPTVTYTVPTDLTKQVDLLYSNNNKAAHKPTTGTAVTLKHEHALSRLTVKASAEEVDSDKYVAYTFHVKEISITGDFNTAGSFNLYDGSWGSLTNKEETYTFFTTSDAATADNALGEEVVDYSGTKTVDGKTTYGNKYLMMIPVDFSKTNATLTVKYTALYGGVESAIKTVTHPISTNFEIGNAYAITIEFGYDSDNIISFSCELEKGTNADGTENTTGWNDKTVGIQ